MKKFIVVGCLMSLGCFETRASSHGMVIPGEEMICPHSSEMIEFKGAFLLDHPVFPYLLMELSKVHTLLNGHTAQVISAQFSHTGDRIVTASSDMTSAIWDAASGERLVRLVGHTDRVRSAHFAFAGDTVVTASDDTTAKIWNGSTGICLVTLYTGTRGLQDAQFNRQGDKVVTAFSDGKAIVWDVAGGAFLQSLEGHTGIVISAEFDISGDKVLTCSTDTTAKIWDSKQGNCLVTLQAPQGAFHSARFSKNGKTVITISEDGFLRIWEAQTGALLQVLLGHSTEIFKSGVMSAECSMEADTLALGFPGGSVRIFETAKGVCVHSLVGHTGVVWSTQLNYEGTGVVTASEDRTARVWNLGRLAELKRFLELEATFAQAILLRELFDKLYFKELMKKHGAEPSADHVRALLNEQTLSELFAANSFTTLPSEIKSILQCFALEVLSKKE